MPGVGKNRSLGPATAAGPAVAAGLKILGCGDARRIGKPTREGGPFFLQSFAASAISSFLSRGRRSDTAGGKYFFCLWFRELRFVILVAPAAGPINGQVATSGGLYPSCVLTACVPPATSP